MPGEGLPEGRQGDRLAAGHRTRSAQHGRCRLRRRFASDLARRWAIGEFSQEACDRGFHGHRLARACRPDDNQAARFASQERCETFEHGLDPRRLLKVGVLGARASSWLMLVSPAWGSGGSASVSGPGGLRAVP